MLLTAGGIEMSNSCGSGQRALAMTGFSAAHAITGAWLLSHAIWSLRANRQSPTIRPVAAASPEGGWIGLTGSF